MKKFVISLLCILMLTNTMLVSSNVFALEETNENDTENELLDDVVIEEAIDDNDKDEIIDEEIVDDLSLEDSEESDDQIDETEQVLEENEEELLIDEDGSQLELLATEKDYVDYSGAINGDFSYSSMFSDSYANYSFKYDDKWFIEDESYIYNHELALMSLKMSMAGFATEDGAGNLKKLFNKLSYSYTDDVIYQEDQNSSDSIVYADTWKNFEYEDESNDTIGYGIAYKNVKYGEEIYTIVAVVIRSANYGSEWASNFTVGSDYDLFGFKQAAQRVQNKLNTYLANIETDYDTKIWLTGYSRGAGVANLCAYYLDEQAAANNLYGVKPEDIYAYTFEAPMGKDCDHATATTYSYGNKSVELENNIFNIINNADLVTKVGMKQLNFSRYGVDKNLPNILTVDNFYSSDIYNDMLTKYKEILEYASISISDDEFKSATTLGVNQNALLNNVCYILYTVLCDGSSDARTNYASKDITNLQNTARLIAADLIAGTRELKSVRIYYKYDVWYSSSTKTSDVIEIDPSSLEDSSDLASLLVEAGAWIASAKLCDVTNCYCEVRTQDASGNNVMLETVKITDTQFDTLLSYATDLIEMYNDDSDYFSSIGNYIAYAHYPELCLAWLESNDFVLYKNQKYTRIKVDKNYSKLTVYYDNSSNVVAELASDEVKSNKIEAYVSDDDYFVVNIPNDSKYYAVIETTAKINKNRYVYLNTYNINNGDILKSSSFDLKGSSKGDKYTIYPSGSSYTLLKNGSTQSLAVATNPDNTDVTININYDSNKGGVNGSGTYSLYDSVNLISSTNSPYKFDGWYDEKNRLISSENNCYYIAQYDTTINAKWSKKTYTIHFDDSLVDSGAMQDLVCNYGEEVTLPTNTFVREKYKISSWSIKETGVAVANNNYVNGTSINISDGEDGATITLVPNWKQYIFDINYLIDDDTTNTNPSTYEYDDNEVVELVSPTKADYIFMGWYENSDFSGDVVTSISCSAEKNYTLYPKFYSEEEYVESIVKISNLSASLSKAISLNVYFELIDDDKLGATFVEYKLGETDYRYNLASLNKQDDEYVLEIKLNANQVDTVINLNLETDGIDGKTEQLSVEDYCDKLIEETSDQELINLANSIKDYGKYSYYYFNKVSACEELEINEGIKNYNFSISRNASAKNIISLSKASLILADETSIKIYYKILDGTNIDSFDISVKDVDDSRIVKTNSYLLIKGIKASELLNYYEISFAKGGNELIKLNYSPMSYAKQVFNYSLASTNLKNLMVKMYEYGFASKEYTD